MSKQKLTRTILDELRNKHPSQYIKVQNIKLPYSDIDLNGYEQFVVSKEVREEAEKLIKNAWKAYEEKSDDTYMNEIETNFRLPFDRMYIETILSNDQSAGFLVDKSEDDIKVHGAKMVNGSARLDWLNVVIKIDKETGGIDTSLSNDGLTASFSHLISESLIKKYGAEISSENLDCEAKKITSAPEFQEKVDKVIAGVMHWVVGIVSLLNAKNGITRTTVPAINPPSGSGKKARRENTRSRFTVVSLSDVEQVASDGTVSLRKIPNAHKVRGHFKRKKKGLYWWRPHVRGHGQMREREAYVVEE